ncbi:Uncharacterised protein [Acinetobacter baumannii]|nr:Uncharacterised protein [Acinetobacter baumannii]SST06107.1 Uncharacterised protein [Acinetobacter baumannii]SST14267.1 Uncharacterised protein [Acinetobacter baumannii]
MNLPNIYSKVLKTLQLAHSGHRGLLNLFDQLSVRHYLDNPSRYSSQYDLELNGQDSQSGEQIDMDAHSLSSQ